MLLLNGKAGPKCDSKWRCSILQNPGLSGVELGKGFLDPTQEENVAMAASGQQKV